MPGITTLVIDDEPAVQENLLNLLKFNFEEIDVVGCASSGKEAVELITKLKPQAIFLDIQMPHLDGFGVLEQVLPRFPGLAVVFVTAYEHYAIEALRSKAIDYIVKPIKITDLKNAVEAVKKYLGTHKKMAGIALPEFPILAIPYQGGIEIVNTKLLLYLVADGSYTEFHFLDGRKILASKSMSSVERTLSDSFFRIHKSCILNLDQLQRFASDENAAILKNGARLAVATRRAAEFREAIAQRFRVIE